MNLRLAILIDHPIPYFAACHRALHASGAVDLRVFFCSDWGVKDYPDPHFGIEIRWDVPLVEGYPHEFLPLARRPGTRRHYWEVDNPQVGSALTRFDPDVVVVHGYARRTNWRAAAWCRRHAKPLLLFSDSHGGIQPSVWKRAIRKVVVGLFYTYVDGALCLSANNRAYHRRYGVPDDRLFPGVCPAEVDRLLQAVPDIDGARRQIRERYGIPGDAFVVLQCAKYAPHKRPLDLLQAVALLRDKGLSVWALLVGEGRERPALECFLREHPGVAVLTGFVNQSSIASYYAAADLLALVSSFDQHPLTLPEGMAFGLPVVVSDRVGSAGATDVARPETNAVLFPVGDITALSTAIERLYRDNALRARMGQASARIAATQTPRLAAELMRDAAASLHAMGSRRSRSGLATHSR